MDSKPGNDTTRDINSFDDVKQAALQTLADILQIFVKHIPFLTPLGVRCKLD